LDTGGLEGSVSGLYDEFVKYINALESIITEKIPDLLTKADSLPQEAEDAQNNAGDELEGLGAF